VHLDLEVTEQVKSVTLLENNFLLVVDEVAVLLLDASALLLVRVLGELAVNLA